MSRMIQIRNVPEDVHRALKRKALDEGLTLSDLLLREVTELARRPTMGELLARIRRRPRVRVSESSAAALRSGREAR